MKTRSRRARLTAAGSFAIGCNYWASHAGTQMWSDWRPAVVARDLGRLRKAGMQVLRVFPLWPDFQPLKAMRTGGSVVEHRLGEAPLPDDECGRAGMSAVAMDRFAQFLDLAAKNDLGCVVGLLTGWMSGRLFVPPAFEGMNVLTDPAALRWQVRFVRHFVGRFRGHPAIAGWDLGNECNCMGPANREQAYLWTAAVVNAIRVADPDRPVISGMHSLTPAGNWSMFDQGELTDLLTVHPYPVFTPYADQDPVNTIRAGLHAAAEARYYSDLGGKPCLCEEIGTLGPLLANETVKADFVRAGLFSLWANDCRGLLWWCASDQTRLEHAPYDWCAVERELGLFREDGAAKPVAAEFTKFRQFLDGLPFRTLPPRTREAVCILTEDQEHWAVAYSAFVLAKQAGFDIEFQHAAQPLREAELYLMPSLKGHRMMDRRRLRALLDRVRQGATLYVSLDDGLPSGFEELTGLEPEVRERRPARLPIAIDGVGDTLALENGGKFGVRYRPTRAEVLGREADGNPAFSAASYGKGMVFFLSLPVETALARTPGGFHGESAQPWWRVYERVAAAALAARAVRKSQPMLAVTEHALSRSERVVVAVNHQPSRLRATLQLCRGWTLRRVCRGQVKAEAGVLHVAPGKNDAVVFAVRRTGAGVRGPADKAR